MTQVLLTGTHLHRYNKAPRKQNVASIFSQARLFFPGFVTFFFLFFFFYQFGVCSRERSASRVGSRLTSHLLQLAQAGQQPQLDLLVGRDNHLAHILKILTTSKKKKKKEQKRVLTDILISGSQRIPLALREKSRGKKMFLFTV